MADVFISYAREDRETAHALAEALGADGLAVWWDRQLAGGSDFTAAIEHELTHARVVLVLWSAASVQSGFVRDESTRARDAGKLLPLRIDAGLPLPLGFGSLHTLDLIDWDGDADDESFVALREAVRARLAGGAQSPSSPVPPRNPLRWRRWRAPAAAAAGAVALAGGLWFALAPDADGQAQAHLRAGLEAHFAREPNLEVARNAYLAALRARPDMAVAHYYLGLAYGQLKLRPAALEQFVAALANADELDAGQRSEAARQRELLSAPEPVALARAAEVEPLPAAAPVAAPAPALPAPASPPMAAATAPLPASAAVVPAPDPADGDARLRLVRVAPGDARRREAQQQVEALVGSDKPARAAAATTLALDETLAADALPALLSQAVAGSPNEAAAGQATSAALRLLQSASPAVLRKNQQEVRRVVEAGRALGGPSADAAQQVAQRLAHSTAPGARPIVYVQIADERQRALARSVSQRLASMGYATPGIENVGTERAPARTQLRLQGASDPALARWMAQHLAKVVQAEVPLQSLRSAKPATDTYEIWFDRDLCVTRTVPDCTAT